ncbi:MAG: DUF560 domain-containing protein [Betaproteobacteria bacterium]|nr:DUF560 domain-containing protein [Betaproteobacteria bacterium]
MHLRSIAVALVCALPLFAAAAPADDVKSLLDQGKSAEAYALGKRYPEELGNPAFDFYYGVAAIDSGHAGEGVLALERYVANFPENSAARLELARGYFVLGDDARAREEFENVLNSNPPPNVQANIQRFRDAIRARESQYRTTAGFYAEAGVGYDTNASYGPASSNILLPNGSVLPLATGTKTGDSFGYFGVGGQVTHPVAPGVALFAAGNADSKNNATKTIYDIQNVNLAGGISFLREKNLYRLTALYGETIVQNDWLRKLSGGTAEVQHQLDELNILTAGVTLADIRYSTNNNNQNRNVDLTALSVGWRRAFVGDWQPLLTLAANYGSEHDVSGFPEFGRKLWGGRAGVAITPAPRWSLSGAALYQQSRYDGVDTVGGIPRRDKYYGAEAIASYGLDRNWSVRAEYTYAKNTGNIALYEYDRHVVMLKLRYEYK